MKPNEEETGGTPGEGEEGAEGNENPEEKNEEGNAPNKEGDGDQTPEKKFSQDEVNTMLAKEKREQQEKVAALKQAGLSDEQIQNIQDKDEADKTKSELTQLRSEKTDALLDKHKDVVEKLSPEQLEKLKKTTPDKVEDFLSSMSSIISQQNTGGDQKKEEESGETPSMEEGAVDTSNIASEDMKLAEGIEKGVATGDWGDAIGNLFGKMTD